MSHRFLRKQKRKYELEMRKLRRDAESGKAVPIYKCSGCGLVQKFYGDGPHCAYCETDLTIDDIIGYG